MAAEAQPRPLLRQRNFLALIGGQLVSISGERLTFVALYGLLQLHTMRFSSPAQSSLLLWLLGASQLLPVLLFSPFVGAWVDRWNLKRVMVVSDALRAGIVVLIPVCYLATNSVWPVNLLVFALFTCNVFFLPAKSAITPEIVPGRSLLLANALLASAGIAGGVAMVPGGWVVDHWGWGPALYLNGVTYLVSVASLLFIRYRPVSHATAGAPVTMRSYLHEVAEGWRLVRSTPVLVLALTALAAVWMAGGFALVAGTQHIARAAGTEAGGLRVAILIATVGIGSGFGIWWLNTRGRFHPRHHVLAGGLVLAAAGFVAFAVSTRFAVFAGAALIMGLGAAAVFVLPETMLQEGTETRTRGRVFGARDFLMRLMLLGGQSVAAVAAPLIGLGPTLLVAAGMIALVGVLAFIMGRRIPAPPMATTRE
jgi:DHA3 family macrolide efflux protein-like MFS transporter